MKKLAVVAILLLTTVGCSTCKDGAAWEYGWVGGYEYAECRKGCCDVESPKKCKCSKRCSCWNNHSAPKQDDQKDGSTQPSNR